MEINQLQIFRTAAETLNFTKTAQLLGYTQSNITGQIRQLEDSLRVKLFERLGRRIQLTNEGMLFLNNARAILELCERAKEEFSPQVFRGILNIGAAETVCIHRLPKILTEFRRAHPLVEIRILTDSCDTLVDYVKNNRIDIAMMLTDRVKATDMQVHPLYEETLIPVASPAHPLAGAKHLNASDLAGECLIITLPGCGYRPLILSMLKERQVQPRSCMELSSIGAIKECTSLGLGIAFLPAIAVQPELAQRKLVELPWTGPQLQVKTQLIFHQEKWLTAAMRAFLEFCLAHSTVCQAGSVPYEK